MLMMHGTVHMRHRAMQQLQMAHTMREVLEYPLPGMVAYAEQAESPKIHVAKQEPASQHHGQDSKPRMPELI